MTPVIQNIEIFEIIFYVIAGFSAVMIIIFAYAHVWPGHESIKGTIQSYIKFIPAVAGAFWIGFVGTDLFKQHSIDKLLDSIRTVVFKSSEGTQKAEVNFVNATDGKIKLYWIDQQGSLNEYQELDTKDNWVQQTYVGHLWLAANEQGQPLALYKITQPQMTVMIKENLKSP